MFIYLVHTSAIEFLKWHGCYICINEMDPHLGTYFVYNHLVIHCGYTWQGHINTFPGCGYHIQKKVLNWMGCNWLHTGWFNRPQFIWNIQTYRRVYFYESLIMWMTFPIVEQVDYCLNLVFCHLCFMLSKRVTNTFSWYCHSSFYGFGGSLFMNWNWFHYFVLSCGSVWMLLCLVYWRPVGRITLDMLMLLISCWSAESDLMTRLAYVMHEITNNHLSR